MEGKFNGRTYTMTNAIEPGMAKGLILNPLIRGELDHIGSMQGNFPGMSQPQVYSTGRNGVLIAAACSCNSQFIDLAWFLSPIR